MPKIIAAKSKFRPSGGFAQLLAVPSIIQLSGDGRERYAPEINKRIRPHLRMSGTSYRVDFSRLKIFFATQALTVAIPVRGPHNGAGVLARGLNPFA